ncbi:GIY-YIG nuclease family protein [Candidatus Margulisiibacteriota bacterium]
MRWHVYILQCADKSLYTGITNDLDRRFAAHKAGKGSKFVRSRKAKKIVHSEKFNSRSKALKREHELKGLSRQEKLKLIKK